MSALTVDIDVPTRVRWAMWVEMDCWMNGFTRATCTLARAVLDGRFTEDQVRAFPVGEYPPALCRASAETLGLPYRTATPVYEGGWRVDIADEEIDAAFRLLRAIPEGDDEQWQFHDDTLAEHGLTIEQVREVWRDLSLTDAARLITSAA